MWRGEVCEGESTRAAASAAYARGRHLSSTSAFVFAAGRGDLKAPGAAGGGDGSDVCDTVPATLPTQVCGREARGRELWLWQCGSGQCVSLVPRAPEGSAAVRRSRGPLVRMAIRR